LRILALLSALLGLALPLSVLADNGPSSTPKRAVTKFGNEEAITPERLKAHLEFVASDEMEGRDTPSRGLDVATLYVATQMKLWGAQPGGDEGTFFQKIPLSQRAINTKTSTIEFDGTKYAFGNGFKSATGASSASGKMVYAGHGYMIKKKSIDPWAGLDVKGKIVIVASGFPKGSGWQDIQGTAGVDFEWPTQAAEKRGALALVTVPDAEYLNGWNAATAAKIGGTTPDNGDQSGGFPTVVVAPALAAAIFNGEQMSGAAAGKGAEAPDKPFELEANKTLRIAVEIEKTIVYTRNVVAIIPGTDPKL
jgi:hypothetical protein